MKILDTEVLVEVFMWDGKERVSKGQHWVDGLHPGPGYEYVLIAYKALAVVS